MNSSYLDPIAIKFGPFEVYWYGLIMATAVFLGLLLAMKESERRNLNPDLMVDLVISVLPLAILGARTYYVIFEWGYYAQHPQEIIAIWHGGLAIHGAIIGALIGGILFAKVKNLSFWKLADIVAPSFILGQAIGRWGNFMNQEAHGGAVSRAFLEGLKLPNWIIEQMNIQGTYYHPTFLYESIWNILVFLFLTFYWKKQDFLKSGEVFLTYISLYSIGRFFIENMRTDSLMLGQLQVARAISIAIILASIALAIYNRKKEFFK
ncbi:prolipoprotein diacylglyceryl transferase [Halanaerobacter jeridensis]|uniref:Phosphatidylglycerol--prolipoprotein diacylglyceryl transferase n=1 Tax=Halanaerobacter jeridensis TaxID=706427 RepID=A0A938XQI7_9FIRM|nr:prolipoprotein diacylglyceryl transferase [Halanaerobacter jeridensis]MBM7557577.1 phosphatidylglycerol:prolipoprotein diacylglycerol transferase [Halanaerobacter jeridensis]